MVNFMCHLDLATVCLDLCHSIWSIIIPGVSVTVFLMRLTSQAVD